MKNPQFDIKKLQSTTITQEDVRSVEAARSETVALQCSGKVGRQLRSGEIEVMEEGKLDYRKRIGYVLASKTQYFSTWDNISYYTTFYNPALFSQLSPFEHSLLAYFCHNSLYYNWQLYQRKAVEAELGCSPSTVTRSIDRLRSLGLIQLQRSSDGQPDGGFGTDSHWFDSDMLRKSYRELVWEEWKAVTGSESVPNRSSWLRVSNAVMWKGQPMYMYKPTEGIVIENRSGVYRELQDLYGQEPGVMFALQDDIRKGRTMAGYWEAVSRCGTRLQPEGRWMK